MVGSDPVRWWIDEGMNINDIARLANVSKATVSRALNHRKDVSEETRERILRIVNEVGYSRNFVARGLATKRLQSIGLVIPRSARFIFGNPYFSELIQGIGEVVDVRGYHLVLSTSPDKSVYLRLFSEKRVDGLILLGSGIRESDFEKINSMLGHDFPVVLINRRSRKFRCPAVTVDDTDGVFQAIGHLYELGHRSIATIAGPPESIHGGERLEAYRRALEDYGLAVDERLVVLSDDTENGGYKAAKELSSRGVEFTAIFAANDLMALGAMGYFQDSGMRIPDDVSIVGFDDIHLASLVRPSLTTIKQSIREVGETAARLLLDILERKDGTLRAGEVKLPTELKVRQSSGPPRKVVAVKDMQGGLGVWME